MTVILEDMRVAYNGKWYGSGSTISVDSSGKHTMYVQYKLKVKDSHPCRVVIYWRTEKPQRKLYELWKYDYKSPRANSEFTHTEKITLDMEKVTEGKIFVGLFQHGKKPQYKHVNVVRHSSESLKEQFAHDVKKYLRGSGSKYVVRWENSDTPVLGYGASQDIITPKVRRVKGSNVKGATITLYLGKTSRMKVEGPYNELPPVRSLQQIVRGWEKGYEKWRMSHEGRYYWFVMPCKLNITYEDSKKICKKKCFEGFKKVYKNHSRTIESNDEYAILDVTDIVSSVEDNVESAKLKVYFNKEDEVRIKGPYDSKPSARSNEEIVEGWKQGEEWSRCKCNGKYYWIIVPCKLKIKYKEQDEEENEPEEPNKPVEPIEPNEPVEPEEPNEPVEPVEPIGPEEQNESNEPSEQPEKVSGSKILLTLECESKFWLPGIQCMIVGPGVDKYILFKDDVQKETIELQEGKKYIIYTKKRFTLLSRYYELTAKPGINTTIGGLLYSIKLKTSK